MNQEPLVQIRDLNFSYDNRKILSGINLTIPRGKVVAIMGSSGCGKTTLLRLIGGQLKPSSGEVMVNGQIIDQLDSAGLYAMRRRMGMLFQFGALFTDMSVFDNVAFQMREHTDLPEDLIHDLVMAWARSISLDPMLVMYDEPFAGLDPISLSVIGVLIRKLNDALGASSIVVTHDVQESLKIVDYVYFVSAGKIVAEGTADEIRQSKIPYVHQFVWGEADGPVPFHYPSMPYGDEMMQAVN